MEKGTDYEMTRIRSVYRCSLESYSEISQPAFAAISIPKTLQFDHHNVKLVISAEKYKHKLLDLEHREHRIESETTIMGTRLSILDSHKDVQVRFRFLDLPPEIRNQIYSTLMWETCPSSFHDRKLSHHFDIDILLLNRQIMVEAIDVIYRKLTLSLRFEFWAREWYEHCFAPWPNLRRCKIHISFEQIAAMHFKGKSSWSSQFRPCLQGLATGLGKLQNLEVLEIEYSSLTSSVDSAGDKLCADGVMDCFRNLRGLKRVSIVGDLEMEYSLELAAIMKLPRKSISETSNQEDLQFANTFFLLSRRRNVQSA